MTAPVLSSCGRCEGTGVVGPVTLSHCPDCRCTVCGVPAITICDDCWVADWVRPGHPLHLIKGS